MSKILPTLQRRLTEHYDAQNFFYSHILFLFSFLQFFLQKGYKKPKIFQIVVQFHRRKPYRNLPYKVYKRPPRAKRPPTTDRAERLTPIQGSRPTPPRAATAPSSLQQTTSRTIAGKCAYCGLSAAHSHQ